MAMVRWNPVRDLMQMREEMDRLFQQFVKRGDGEEGTWGEGVWAPPVDIYETGEAFILKAELPGLSKDDLQIELHENRLTLRGERKWEADAKEGQSHRRERAYGRFERSFWLPASVDAEKIQATFKDGVLELRIPKSETAKPKQITIAEAEAVTAKR
jgi:HSP20 family protein